jgi:hypothetical protein
MAPQLDPSLLDTFKEDTPALPSALTGAFLELFELLEEYAPVWYTEEHHNRALAVLELLKKR